MGLALDSTRSRRIECRDAENRTAGEGMTFELKPLHRAAIPAALEKAEHLRTLNEAREAESICLDILRVEPDHQKALVTLLLALTDQFGRKLTGKVKEARAVLPRLTDPYSRDYYEGIICERRAKAHHKSGEPGSAHVAYHWFREAMACFERAEAIRPPDNDEAALRWNTCARILTRNPDLQPAPANPVESMLE
jgi:hypothetical protein